MCKSQDGLTANVKLHFYTIVVSDKVSELSQQVEQLCQQLDNYKSSSREEITRLTYTVEEKVSFGLINKTWWIAIKKSLLDESVQDATCMWCMFGKTAF